MCPPGTYNPSTGIQALEDCTNCTAGYYCPDYNMTAVGPECQQGNFKYLLNIYGMAAAKMHCLCQMISEKMTLKQYSLSG